MYYLSASSKDTMDNWVDRLHRVFLRELMTNARGSEDGMQRLHRVQLMKGSILEQVLTSQNLLRICSAESVLRNFAQGVLAVDTSLVSAVTLAVNVQVRGWERCERMEFF